MFIVIVSCLLLLLQGALLRLTFHRAVLNPRSDEGIKRWKADEGRHGRVKAAIRAVSFKGLPLASLQPDTCQSPCPDWGQTQFATLNCADANQMTQPRSQGLPTM